MVERDALELARQQVHVLRAIDAALARWGEVADLMFGAADTKALRRSLQELLELDKTQATAVMDMQLRRVPAAERAKIAASLAEVEATLRRLEAGSA